MNQPAPIRELLTEHTLALTPTEAKIAQVLLNDYPVAGLGTATALARRAGVSDPSVIRMVSKLGFDGFAAFQQRLLEEVEAGLRSPLMMLEAKRPVRATGARSASLRAAGRRWCSITPTTTTEASNVSGTSPFDEYKLAESG